MHSIFGCVDLLLGGKKSPKSQFYVGFGLVGEVLRCWRVASKGVHLSQVHQRIIWC